MGQWLAPMVNVSSTAMCRIICIGLEGAGKTTFLKTLMDSLHLPIKWIPGVPTASANMEAFNYTLKDGSRKHFIFNDIAGSKQNIWSKFVGGVQPGILFLCDSTSNETRLNEAKEALYKFMEDIKDPIKDPIVLLLATKTDLPGALSVETIAERFEIKSTKRTNPIHVMGCCNLNLKDVKAAIECLSLQVDIDYNRKI